MHIESDALRPGEPIPQRFTADGDNHSPPLRWRDIPPGARELALVLEDVKTTGETRFTHWLLYGIRPEVESLPEGIKSERRPYPPGGVVQGTNAQGNVGYAGPAPAAGGPHHYRFTLFALDKELHLPPGTDRAHLERALWGHVLADSSFEVLYERPHHYRGFVR